MRWMTCISIEYLLMQSQQQMGTLLQTCKAACCGPINTLDEFEYIAQDIYGTDTRKRLVQTDQITMNTCLGLISSKTFTSNGTPVESIGTGTLIGPNLVVTCAHNVYDRDRKQVKTDLAFYPALNGNRKYSRRIEIADLRLCDKYLQKRKKISFNYDIALLLLTQEIEVERPVNFLVDYTQFQQVHLYGYPRDINLPDHNIYQQYGDYGPVKIQNGRIVHKIATTGGQSGSPMFISAEDGQGNLEYYMIGVHAGASPKVKQNYGVLISQEIFQLLIAWQIQMTENDTIKYLDAERQETQVEEELQISHLRSIPSNTIQQNQEEKDEQHQQLDNQNLSELMKALLLFQLLKK